MAIATVTSKGQITIPAEVRKSLGLVSGSRVSFVPTGDGSYQIVAATGSVSALKGLVSPPTTPVSLERMDEAITEGVRAGLHR